MSLKFTVARRHFHPSSTSLQQNLRAERAFARLPEKCFRFVSSEIELERELNQPRVVYRIVNDAKGGLSIDVLLAAASRTAHIELRMIEQVEELRAELQIHSFPERKREILDD